MILDIAFLQALGKGGENNFRAAMANKVYLHIGAHRTGTSSFQLCLEENRDVIRAVGYREGFPARDGVKSGDLSLRLPQPRHKDIREFVPRIRRQVARDPMRYPDHPIVISEENIIGGLFHFQQGLFYPSAEKRFETLNMALETRPERVLLVVRDYAPLYVSCFRQRAVDRKVGNFRECVPNYLAMDRGWPELVTVVQKALQPRHLTVVRYENRGESRMLLHRLLPDVPLHQLSEPDRSLNVRGTDAALIALQKRYETGDDMSRWDRRKLLEDMAGDTRNLGFAEFTDAESEALNLRYTRDLDKLSRMQGLTLI